MGEFLLVDFGITQAWFILRGVTRRLGDFVCPYSIFNGHDGFVRYVSGYLVI